MGHYDSCYDFDYEARMEKYKKEQGRLDKEIKEKDLIIEKNWIKIRENDEKLKNLRWGMGDSYKDWDSLSKIEEFIKTAKYKSKISKVKYRR